MAVSIRKSFANIFGDREILPKYTVLVILSFCVGLLTFVFMAKNYMWLPVAVPLYFIASILATGYDIKYVKELMNNENSKMPHWTKENFVEFFSIGIKYLIATIILFLIIFSIIVIPIIIIGSLYKMYNLLISLLIVPLLIATAIFMYLLICFPGIIYTFINNNYDILTFFNIKKNCSYFSVNYFISLFAIMCLALPISFIAQCTTVRLRYALFYIIPLMIAPIIRMVFCNLMSQAYRANNNNEDGSIAKMFGLLALLLFEIIIFTIAYIIFLIKFA